MHACSAFVASSSASISSSTSSSGADENRIGAISVVGRAPSATIFSTSRRTSARSSSANPHRDWPMCW